MDAHNEALAHAAIEEVVLLSTCNRTEMFCVLAEGSGHEAALGWLCQYHGIEISEMASYCYMYSEQDMVKHLIEVASGLDSMVLGEPQIFGQMKSAFSLAQEGAAVGPVLGRLFQHGFTVAKKVRTDTAIGENPVSVAYAAVDMSRHIFADLSQVKALLIGAGETIELVATHLAECGVSKMTVANRTLGRAREVASKFDAQPVLLAEVPEQLVDADIVITSTGSQLPILGKGAVESAVKKRRHRPIFMVDIAVPRDVEEEVGQLADVYLYTIDDLREIVEANKRSRQSEARKADGIIDKGVADWLAHRRSLDTVHTLKEVRSQAEAMRDEELQKALAKLRRGEDAEAVLQSFGRGLTNKMIHQPSVVMKKAGSEGRLDIVPWVRELFGLDQNNESEDL